VYSHWQGASDDIMATKNTLYQHLTWDPEKSLSMCSKLALPLATPANTSPPPSPKRALAFSSSEGPFAGEGALRSACLDVQVIPCLLCLQL
jgi:hypothetical protein